MSAPKALKAGNTIGIAAPSSPFDRSKFMKGVHALERRGFNIYHRNDIFDQNRYLAGTDSRRAEEFMELFLKRDIAAIMFARGGYGSQRIIPLLDLETIGGHKKPVIGFSDVTALLTTLRQRAGVPTFYGPVMTLLGRSKDAVSEDSLIRALTTAGPLGEIPVHHAKAVNAGEAKGPLVGGCLSLINSSIGTPYELNTDGAILFIEEVNEEVYVIDRMLTQLKNAGKLSGVKGIVFGSLIPPADETHNIESMIRDVLSGYDGPIVMDFPAGHIDSFITLPLGAEAHLIAEKNSTPKITFTSGLLT
jgi:muramoyltetrapeptide carboxypeptidase